MKKTYWEVLNPIQYQRFDKITDALDWITSRKLPCTFVQKHQERMREAAYVEWSFEMVPYKDSKKGLNYDRDY